MTSAAEMGAVDEPRRVQVAGDGPACGKFVAKDGDRDVLCDLPAGHPDSLPCSAPLDPRPSASAGR